MAGRWGSNGGRRHSPSCLLAVKARAYTGLHRFMSGGPGVAEATSGPTPTTGVTREGWGQAGAQPRCSQVPRSVFRIPELQSLGRALQARTTSRWFSKEVCGFSFSFLSFFFPSGQRKTLVKDKLPGGGGACPARKNFHQGFLTWSAAW